MENRFESVAALLKAHRPRQPVYCVFPHVYEAAARRFLQGFPGRVLYAVKANAEPEVLRALAAGGVRCYDCASIDEIERVHAHCGPSPECYFMAPVRLRGAAAEAQSRFGVRRFVVDHLNALDSLCDEIDPTGTVIFARMGVSHESAVFNLSAKFGAPPEDVPALIGAIRERGAEAALAFNVGSSVGSPDAYRHALTVAKDTLAALPAPVRLVDIGGGYPRAYPGFQVPPLSAFFDTVTDCRRALPLADDGELLAEPGRALSAPGMSSLAEVLLRKDQRLYLNDGMYGAFWELNMGGHERYPTRVWRDGQPLVGDEAAFRLYGPTCDSADALPAPFPLPADIRAGDYIEFGRMGAYSVTGRTDFNGHYSDLVVSITGTDESPPGAG